MKTIVALLLMSSLALTGALSQQYKTTLSTKSIYTLKLTDIEADLNIIKSSGNELIIRVSSLPEMPEKAAGLRPLTKSGVDNTGIGLNIEMLENIISLSGGKSGGNLKYEIHVPDNVSISINNPGYDRLYEFRLSDISKEIEIFISSGNIKMSNVTGPVIIRTDKGNIDISFTGLSQEGAMSIICQNGDIDITVPEKEDATFKLSSGNGDIYTDLDLKETKSDFLSQELFGYYLDPENNKSFFKFDCYPFDKLSEVVTPEIDKIEKIEVNKDKGILRFEKKKGDDKILEFEKKYQVIPDNYQDAQKVYEKSLAYSYSHPLFYYDFFFYDFKGTLNNGGVEIAVKTENGNIYLRKAKP